MIKKVYVPKYIYVVAAIVSNFVIFLISLIVLVGVGAVLKVEPTWHIIEGLVPLVILFVMTLGIGLILATLNVFFRDMAQIVGIIMQYAMCVIPIMLSESQYPAFMRPILKINPMYYIVEGYRDSLIRHIGFWEHPLQTVYFWAVVIIMFIIGRTVFTKMKPHFADVM